MSTTNRQIETIPFENIIDIKISGAFYTRIQQFLIHYSQQKAPEDFMKHLANVQKNEPADEFEYHLLTLLMISQEVESSAKAQDKIKMQDMPEVPTT